MAGLGDLMSKIPGVGGGNLMAILVAIVLGGLGLTIAGVFVWWMVFKKRKWNLKVEFRMPRDVKEVVDEDGEIRVKGTLVKEWGRGYYDAKRGAVFVKRKGKKPVPVKPFNVKEFLSGKDNILTVVQVGIEDYRPILEDSYLELVDNETGNEAALLKVKIDTTESRSWRNSFERESKSAYTLLGFLHEHGQLIGFGFILLCMLVGFAIVYAKVA